MSGEELALTVVPPVGLERAPETASALFGRAKDVAGVCREIVLRTAISLNSRSKKKHVQVEGWQSIAAAFGCTPSVRLVEEVEGGSKAVAELKRDSDGMVLSEAEGFCGTDEPKWATQPLYARRAMAQTRAISRVCRSKFAFVVVLIDENLSTTPAEEMPGIEAHGEIVEATATPAPARTVTSTSGPVVRPAVDSKDPGKNLGHLRTDANRVSFGKANGQYLCDVDGAQLEYLLKKAKQDVDTAKPQWKEKNARWYEAVRAEVERRISAK